MAFERDDIGVVDCEIMPVFCTRTEDEVRRGPPTDFNGDMNTRDGLPDLGDRMVRGGVSRSPVFVAVFIA